MTEQLSLFMYGNLVKITRYNKEGKPTEINTYGGKDEYVHRQEPISVVKFTFNDDGSLHYSQERNEDGVTVKYIYYNSDDTVNHYAEYERGEWGVVKKKTVYGADGTIDHYIENEYDEHGVIIRKSEFNADGTVRNYCVYDNVYAYRGEELIGYESVTMTKYNSDNTVDHYVVYGYDENLSYPLHPISEIVYKADGKVDSYAEYSDEDQNWSNGGERKTVYDAGRDMLYYVVTQDDSYEHIKTETKYSPDGNVIEVIKTIY